LVPFALETASPDGDSVFSLEIRQYGEKADAFVLIEDDGVTFNYRSGAVKSWTVGADTAPAQLEASERYRIASVRRIG